MHLCSSTSLPELANAREKHLLLHSPHRQLPLQSLLDGMSMAMALASIPRKESSLLVLFPASRLFLHRFLSLHHSFLTIRDTTAIIFFLVSHRKLSLPIPRRQVAVHNEAIIRGWPCRCSHGHSECRRSAAGRRSHPILSSAPLLQRHVEQPLSLCLQYRGCDRDPLPWQRTVAPVRCHVHLGEHIRAQHRCLDPEHGTGRPVGTGADGFGLQSRDQCGLVVVCGMSFCPQD